MKKSQLLIATAFILAVASAFTTKSKPFVLQGYKTGACTSLQNIPSNCAVEGSATCVDANSKTWYRNSGCATEFKKD